MPTNDPSEKISPLRVAEMLADIDGEISEFRRRVECLWRAREALIHRLCMASIVRKRKGNTIEVVVTPHSNPRVIRFGIDEDSQPFCEVRYLVPFRKLEFPEASEAREGSDDNKD